MTHTYEDLKGKTIAELRDIAKELPHDALQGYTQMNKEHLLPALCKALGIDTHRHPHHHHAPVEEAFDKSAVKARVRALKVERDKAIESGDNANLRAIRRQIHALKRRIKVATA